MLVESKPRFLILVVEDSDEDYEALHRCFRHLFDRVRLERCETGKQALEYLDRCIEATENHQRRSLPSLILLDLNLPGIDGRGVLHRIKQNPQLKQIPTVILTTSNNPKDIEDCYQLGGNSYLLKAMEFKQFKKTIQVLIDYWLDTVILPPRGLDQPRS